MKKKERFSPPAVGGSMLLVIFSVLCLTVFALLSLSTVQAEKRMAEGAIQAVTAYYEVDCRAEMIYARLRRGKKVEGVDKEGNQYRYECPISENQKLVVELQCTDHEWSVLCWQAVAQAEIGEDDNPKVWDGQ